MATPSPTMQNNIRKKPSINNNNLRLFINFPSKSPSPYHNLPSTLITVPPPKLKIKFPSLLIKKTRNHEKATATDGCSSHNAKKNKKKKKWRRKGKVLRRKVRAIIRGTLGNNKHVSSMGTAGDDKVHNQSDEFKECMEERDLRETKDTNDRREESVEDQKKQFKFNAALPSLARVPSRGLDGLRKIGRAMSMRKIEAQSYQVEEEEQEGEELCKKRILMGKKCRPLNISGVLHYDKDGVLVPEDI